MKKLSALVATVVLGISGVAAAAPMRGPHGPIATQFARPQALRWTLLDSARAAGGRQVIHVSGNQRFTKLKLEANRGTALIDKVLVTFANGRTQTIEVDARISGMKIIDLNGGARDISRIVIVSQGRSRASFSVLAA